MQFLDRINLKKFWLFSLGLTGIFVFFVWSNENHIKGVLSFYVLTLINQGILAYALYELFYHREKTKTTGQKLILGALLIGKLLILIIGITLSIHFMQKNIIIPLTNYILQIFVLALSGKK